MKNQTVPNTHIGAELKFKLRWCLKIVIRGVTEDAALHFLCQVFFFFDESMQKTLFSDSS